VVSRNQNEFKTHSDWSFHVSQIFLAFAVHVCHTVTLESKQRIVELQSHNQSLRKEVHELQSDVSSLSLQNSTILQMLETVQSALGEMSQKLWYSDSPHRSRKRRRVSTDLEEQQLLMSDPNDVVGGMALESVAKSSGSSANEPEAASTQGFNGVVTTTALPENNSAFLPAEPQSQTQNSRRSFFSAAEGNQGPLLPTDGSASYLFTTFLEHCSINGVHLRYNRKTQMAAFVPGPRLVDSLTSTHVKRIKVAATYMYKLLHEQGNEELLDKWERRPGYLEAENHEEEEREWHQTAREINNLVWKRLVEHVKRIKRSEKKPEKSLLHRLLWAKTPSSLTVSAVGSLLEKKDTPDFHSLAEYATQGHIT
jgi:hypothetical protein